MTSFWILWTVTAAMIAVAVHVCLRGFATGRPGSPLVALSARLAALLLVALLGSLGLRVVDCLLLSCVLLAVAVTVAAVVAIRGAAGRLQRNRHY